MKSTLCPYNEKPEPFLDIEPSARLAKAVTRTNQRIEPVEAENKRTETRVSRLLEAFYYWVQSRS